MCEVERGQSAREDSPWEYHPKRTNAGPIFKYLQGRLVPRKAEIRRPVLPAVVRSLHDRLSGGEWADASPLFPHKALRAEGNVRPGATSNFKSTTLVPTSCLPVVPGAFPGHYRTHRGPCMDVSPCCGLALSSRAVWSVAAVR
ncbi:hypothetical protein EUAN_24050 [Andreesenia angusta]|uniref:Uncharacterized protein n=1 Tax=Andreesenia angusta TaxID=39480 RepID=A0A1S1V475_9FIRM|nr:hypothetical protein EUAN_24050 [Andreesenia angusta]